MESRDFFNLVRGYFGGGIDYFPGKCIEWAPDNYLTTFLGQRLSLNRDRQSVLESLRVVDEWCRLLLPDKFLERYEAALAKSDSER